MWNPLAAELSVPDARLESRNLKQRQKLFERKVMKCRGGKVQGEQRKYLESLRGKMSVDLWSDLMERGQDQIWGCLYMYF